MYLLINPDNSINYGNEHPVKEDLCTEHLRLIEFPNKTLQDVVGDIPPQTAYWDETNQRVIMDPSIKIKTQLQEARDKAIALSKEARKRLVKTKNRTLDNHMRDKEKRAERFLAGLGTDEDTLLLTLECEARGFNETPELLANKQKKQTFARTKAMVIIDGAEAATLQSLEQTTSYEKQVAILLAYRQQLKGILSMQ